MWLRTLFISLKDRSAQLPDRRARRGDACRRSAAARLRVEPLEDRTVPSLFTVTNLLDGGPGSLREAVAAANSNSGADTIDFATTGTIALTSGQLDITDSVTINGPGAAALTVSGEGVSRVLGIAGDPTVVIAGLTVANGWAHGTAPGVWGYGTPGVGMTIAGGSVTLDHVTVTGNIAEGTPNSYYTSGMAAGGGIFVAGGTLTLDQCTVSGNEALGGPGVVEYYVDEQFTYSTGYAGGQARGGRPLRSGRRSRVRQPEHDLTQSGERRRGWRCVGGGLPVPRQRWRVGGRRYPC